jgi:hypothetical protein
MTSAMAEPPSPLTDLLRDARYPDFIREVHSRGLLRQPNADLQQLVAALHHELKAQRHPPGPTIEWLLIDRLVQLGLLDPKIRGGDRTGSCRNT